MVGTPGKILDIIKNRNLNTKLIKIFVLDEADQLLDLQALGEQSKKIQR